MADRKRRRISSSQVPEPPPGTFSRAIQVGDQLFVAGMTASSANGAEGGDSMFEQTRVVFTRIRHLVESAGGTMNDIVRMTGFITDMKRREEYMRARRDFFSADPPAATLVEVTALAGQGLLIEVEVQAVVGSSSRAARRAVKRSSKPARAGRRR